MINDEAHLHIIVGWQGRVEIAMYVQTSAGLASHGFLIICLAREAGKGGEEAAERKGYNNSSLLTLQKNSNSSGSSAVAAAHCGIAWGVGGCGCHRRRWDTVGYIGIQ